MKKLTFLFLFITLGVVAQQQKSYGELTPNSRVLNQENSEIETIITRADNSRNPVLDTYTNRIDFEMAYDAICNTPGGLIFEDFSAAPIGITICGPIISSAGDDCFPPGAVVDGFEVTSSFPSNEDPLVVGISVGEFLGNTIPLVGASYFSDFTIVNFPEGDVYAVGTNYRRRFKNSIQFRIFDIGGNLLETHDFDDGLALELYFFGFIADEPISRIEIEEANDSGELIGGLTFGTCTLLGVDEHLLSQISVYPNPASDVLNVSIPSTVEVDTIVLYDMLGKDTGVKLIDGAINLSYLVRGVYILTLNTSAGILSKKIVKQ